MVSEAYERNFQGLASAIQTGSNQTSELAKQIVIAQKQLQDVLIRLQELETNVQIIMARRD